MIKAYAAHEPKGKLQAFEYDPGALKAHEIEIDVQFCGICHSDLSVIDNEWGMTQYPVVAGHEVVGTISQVGDHVKDLKVGQAVAWGGMRAIATCASPATLATIISARRRSPPSSVITAALLIRCAEANCVVPIPDGIDLESASRSLWRGDSVQSAGSVRYSTDG